MDIAVIKKAISGDPAAFEKLYQSTHDKGFSVAYSVLKDSYEAEDILQDSYIKMYEKLDSLQNPAQFESWFYTIVRNRALDYLRSTKKDSHPDLFSAYESDENPDFIFEDTLVSDYREFNPEANVDYTETKRIIADIIDGLPEMQRECIILRFQRDMKISEIAEHLDMPESTVKSNLNYGKKKIEAEVKALEKQGVRLYSITPLLIIPFLRWMWGNKVPVQLTEAAMEMANATQFAGSSSMGGSSSSFGGSSSTGSGSATNARSVSRASAPKSNHIKSSGGSHATTGKHTAVTGKAVATKSAAAATGTATKAGGTILAAKIMAGIAAVSLIGGIAVMTLGSSNKDKSTNGSDIGYVQSETVQTDSAQQNTLPVTDEVVLTEDFLKGEWNIDGSTDSYNKESLRTMFGSMISLATPCMSFGDNGEFSYGVGAAGGTGSYQIVDGQIEYSITGYNGGYQERSIIKLEVVDGTPRLIQVYGGFIPREDGSLGDYYIVWSRRNDIPVTQPNAGNVQAGNAQDNNTQTSTTQANNIVTWNPATDDISKLVGMKTVQVNDTEYLLPIFLIDSDDARKLNQEMQYHINPLIREFYTQVPHSCAVFGKFLTIAYCGDRYDDGELVVDGMIHTTDAALYCIDITTGKRVTRENLNENYTQDIQQLMHESLYRDFSSLWDTEEEISSMVEFYMGSQTNMLPYGNKLAVHHWVPHANMCYTFDLDSPYKDQILDVKIDPKLAQTALEYSPVKELIYR